VENVKGQFEKTFGNMMMAKADVLSLVTTLSVSQDNTTESSIFYDEIVREMGFFDILTGTETINVTSGVATYDLAANTIRAIEFHSAHSGFLTKSDGKGLSSLFGAAWRNKVGTPLAVTMDQEDDDAFRLVPTPDANDTITVIRTEFREDVPVWLELPIAFEILHREFMRESDHQDLEYSGFCKNMSVLLFQLVGVKRDA
jgi:hypothetical protein